MGKYIKYRRISEIYEPQQIEDLFDSIVKEGWELLHYNEKILETKPVDRIHVVVVMGKLNMGVL